MPSAPGMNVAYRHKCRQSTHGQKINKVKNSLYLTHIKEYTCWVWWHTSLMPALGKQRKGRSTAVPRAPVSSCGGRDKPTVSPIILTDWAAEKARLRVSGVNFWFQLYHDSSMNLSPDVLKALSTSLKISSSVKWRPFPSCVPVPEPPSHTLMLSVAEQTQGHLFPAFLPLWETWAALVPKKWTHTTKTCKDNSLFNFELQMPA